MNVQRATRATLILADISGYTGFLAAVGTAHREQLDLGETPPAYPLMTTLLDAIVGSLTPTFALAKLEGDAVFAYADDGDLNIRGSELLACVQGCYARFREHLAMTENALTCDCHACSSGARLDLKFVIHHGSYIAQTIAGSTELLGPDVTVAHQMLKNDVVTLTGWQAYALLSEAAVEYLEVPREHGTAIDLRYEHSGPMAGLVLPLRT
jgi:hypothetical protein